MRDSRRMLIWTMAGFVLMLLPVAMRAQEGAILTKDQLSQVVPSGFYFEGRSAATQMYNATAVKFGEKSHVIAALVDTSGYATDVREKVEGFLIADLAIKIGGKELGVGAYAFGFTKEGMMNVFDLAGTQLFSVKGTRDNALRAPRPLVAIKGAEGIRLYRGKDFVNVAPK